MSSRLKIIYEEVLFSPPITNSSQAYREFMSIWDTSTIRIVEKAYVLFLNGNNQVIGYYDINTGTQREVSLHIKLCLACALCCMAYKVIIAHSHPSGLLKPSELDILKTKKFKEACDLMDIEFADHLIVTNTGYFSFVDNGIKI